jgi:glycosyltransferase involved in cell wall biosynthesis
MHILMIGVSEDNLHKNIGGVLDRHLRYANLVSQISIVLYNRKSTLPDIEKERLSVYPINKANIVFAIYFALKKIYSINKVQKIDVVSTQDPFLTAIIGLMAKWLFGIPLHIQNHSSFIDNKVWISERPRLFNVLNKIGKFNIKRANRLRVVNNHEKEIYINNLGIDASSIDVAPVPIDITFWQEKQFAEGKKLFCQKHKIDDDSILIGWAGRFVKVKNIPFLFESISLVQKSNQKVVLVLVGDNTDSYFDLKQLEDTHKINPVYLGLLNKEELRDFYQTIDIYAHTSDYEGFGLVIAEAQASGKPVVTTDVAGAKETVIDGKTGIITEHEVSQFSRAVHTLVIDATYRNQLGANGFVHTKSIFNTFNMEKAVIESMINAKNRK